MAHAVIAIDGSGGLLFMTHLHIGRRIDEPRAEARSEHGKAGHALAFDAGEVGRDESVADFRRMRCGETQPLEGLSHEIV